MEEHPDSRAGQNFVGTLNVFQWRREWLNACSLSSTRPYSLASLVAKLICEEFIRSFRGIASTSAPGAWHVLGRC